MGDIEDFEAELGIDYDDPKERLAKELVDADHKLLEDLVNARVASGMSKAQVAAAMGRDRAVVTNFERMTADPHLSTIRRYAMAIGARITHRVETGFLADSASHMSRAAGRLDVVNTSSVSAGQTTAGHFAIAVFSAGATAAGTNVRLEGLSR